MWLNDSESNPNPSWTQMYSEEASKWDETESILRAKNMTKWREIESLKSLLEYYGGSGDFITRWMIQNSIKGLAARMEDTDRAIGMGQLALIKSQGKVGETESGIPWAGTAHDLERYYKYKEMSQGTPTPNASYKDLEIPEWMQKYMETSQPVGEGAYNLRPLGAQANENEDEWMGQLQGYLGWTKSGAPKKFTEDYARQMQSLPDRWERYAKESQRLFPTSGLGKKTNWSTARQ